MVRVSYRIFGLGGESQFSPPVYETLMVTAKTLQLATSTTKKYTAYYCIRTTLCLNTNNSIFSLREEKEWITGVCRGVTRGCRNQGHMPLHFFFRQGVTGDNTDIINILHSTGE